MDVRLFVFCRIKCVICVWFFDLWFDHATVVPKKINKTRVWIWHAWNKRANWRQGRRRSSQSRTRIVKLTLIVLVPGMWVKTSQLLKLLLPSKYAPSIWNGTDKRTLSYWNMNWYDYPEPWRNQSIYFNQCCTNY